MSPDFCVTLVIGVLLSIVIIILMGKGEDKNDD